MAINFLNTVDLNYNQLNKAAIQNLAADPAIAVLGQVYYNTAGSVLKICVTANIIGPPAVNAVWASVSGDIQSVDASTVNNRLGIAVTTPLGPDPKVGLDVIGLTALGAPALDDSLIIYDLSTTTNKRLSVADIIGTSTWKLEGDGADQQTIVNGDIVDFVGGTYLTATASSPSANNFEVKFNHDSTTRTNTTSTSSPNAGATFTALDSITTNTTGHVTGVNTKTVTLPDTRYTLPVTAGVVSPGAPTTGIITLTDSDGTTDPVTFVGTSGRIDVAGNAAGSTITVNLTDSISVVDNINLGGVITQTGGVSTTGVNAAALTASTTLILTANNTAVIVGMQISGIGIPDNITVVTVTDAKTFQLSGAITIANAITVTFEEVNNFSSPLSMNNNRIHEVKTGVLGTDGVNLGQVQDLVAGIGLFKGGYDATTGLTVNLGAGNGSLDGASNIALDTGDFFVVTVAGTAFYTTDLDVGDMIFANTTIAASSTPPISSYTVVIQDANIATAAATDAATEKGVAGFDSANFNVSASGWVQLAPQRNPYGRKQSLNNTAPSSRAVSGGVTTFTVDLAASSLFGLNADAENVMVEVTTQAAAGPYQTVYADVTRSGSATVAIAFTGSIAIDTYQVLLTHI